MNAALDETVNHRLASYTPLKLRQPSVAVVIDVEEEFDWSQPFSTQNQSVSSLEWLRLAHCMLTSLGLRPAYLVTYPIAKSPHAKELLSELVEDGCEVGAQLHPWVTPPIEEEVTEFNSFPSNLPMDLERRKIITLIDAIKEAVGVRPTIYKAGRYGLELSRAEQLIDLGFRVDTSVMPHSSQSETGGGPNFFGLPEQPFWLDDKKRLLGLPSSQGIVGGLSEILPSALLRHIYSPAMMNLHVPGVFARLGLLERLRLSPEGHTFENCKRLVDRHVQRGHTCFVVSFHSPSLQPGCTPYVRTQRELDRLLDDLYMTLRYLLDDIGAVPMSPTEIHAELTAGDGP